MHLSEEQMIKFIDLYNEKKLKIGFPGHFYVSPYFMKPAT
jgi:xylose isomerase